MASSTTSQKTIAAAMLMVTPALTFRANSDKSEKLPARIKFLDWGENEGRTTGARVIVSERTLSSLPKNQQLCACDTVELDYEHQSVKGHPNYKEDPRHSAAHGTVEVIEGEGVFLNVTDYTPNGKEHAGNYKDVSGVCRIDPKTNELLLVSSVALTQRGDVSGMEFSDHVVALTAEINQSTQPKTMDKDDKYRALLISVLGLKPDEGETDISDEAIAAAAESFSKPAALSAESTKPAKKEGEDSDPIVAALTARLDKMEAKQVSAEKDALVKEATVLGKVIPLSAEEIKQADVATLSAMIARLPEGQVATEKKTTKETPAGEVALSAEEEKLCAELGLTKEEFLAAE